MALFDRDELEAAAALVYRQMTPTAQIEWPTLSAATGARVVVKHENHAPTGAFKVRGGITFIDWLKRTEPGLRGIVTATRGNHGQSQARAARAAGLEARIYVPEGNSPEKNAAMRAWGGEVITFGRDFDEAREEAMRVAASGDFYPVPPFHRELVRGVATYGFELMNAHPDLDTIYVPIGAGSGISGTIAARDALGLATKIVGVVATGAAGAKLSVEAGHLVETEAARTFADGLAVRVPVQEAFDIYSAGADRIVAVEDEPIAEAVRLYLSATHNLAEGAGAAPLAALMAERERMAGRKVGLILSGGNLDSAWLGQVLAGTLPAL